MHFELPEMQIPISSRQIAAEQASMQMSDVVAQCNAAVDTETLHTCMTHVMEAVQKVPLWTDLRKSHSLVAEF